MALQQPFSESKITTGTNRADDSNNDDNEEQVAKAVFLQLDPVLGVLLKLIQQYQATIQAERAILTQNSQSPHQAASISQLQEQVLSMLQTQCVVLDRLRKLLQDFPSSSSSQQQHQQLALSDQQVGRSLVILWDYLSLPLLAVLRGTTKGQADWSVLLLASSSSSSNQQQQQQEQIRIRQSASWKCIERAARTLTVTLQLVHKGNQRLSNKVIMSALIPCTTALPSGREISQSNGNGNDNSSSSSSTTSVAVGATMDRGEDSCAAILEAIATLAVPCNSQQQAEETDSLAQEIAGALGGALVARVVDSCVALIAPDQPKEPSTVLLSQALKTVKALMNAIPIPRVWRGVFPGCFAGLYRRLLHSLRVGKPSLSGVVVEGIQVLCLLLQQSLQPSSEAQAVVATTTESIVADLQSLVLVASSSAPSTDEPTGETDSSARGDGSAFLVQAKQRLPAPLTVLVNLLMSARSPAVRKQATGLFRTVLVDTRACWVCTADAFMSSAMEACLVLSNDRDDDISSAARAALKDYLISSDSNQDINVLVLPRILTLIEELPILAQRLKDAELRTKLTLLSGYLSMNTTSKVASKKLRTSLVSGPISITIRNALTSMVDVDFESFEPRAANAIVVASDSNHHTVRRPLGPPLRNMTNETKEVAVNMLRSLGKALGPKYTAVFVDACIADLFEACVSRVESRVSLVGKSQTEWLHERIGSIFLVQEMLIGAFAMEPEGPGASKRDQKRSRILSDLASSILPIVISSPLYDLPTYPSHQGAEVVNERGMTSQVGSVVALDNARGREVLSAALRGNASISFYLLGVTGTMFDLLGRAGHSFLPLVLYPVLKNIGSRNILLNQEMAFHVLESLVTSCEYENMTDLLTENMDNLMGTLMGRIRVSGGRSLGKTESDDETITVVSTVTAMLRIAAGSTDNTQVCERSFSPSMLSYMEELVTVLIARFDHQAGKSANQRDTVTAFVQLFDAALTHMDCWYEYVETKTPVNSSAVSESSKEAWLALLDPFLIDKERRLSPEEGFELYRDQHVQDKEPAIGFQLVSASEIEFVKRIISRCSFLLSHPSLTSQIQSCAALIRGFSFLGAVARRVCPGVDEPNGSSTAILRQVSVSWPAISARLKAASSNVRVSRGTSLLVLQPSSQRYATSLPTNIGEQRVFLSKLFELVGVMTVCADDFMASRFRQDVWPCIVQVLGSFATSRQGLLSTEPQSFPSPVAVSRPVNQKRVFHAQKLSASELGLALGIIQCLARVFGHRPSGLVLAGLIPSAGSMLFPFLESSDDDGTHEALETICMTALRNMVLIDCDALLRPLLDLSARGLPPYPLGVLAATENAKEQALGRSPDSVLVKRANELVDFIEALPEQKLD
jgi:hypothetical protein